MMASVRSTGWFSVLFYIAWIIISKYILLMLFLAVVMEAFERSYAELDAKFEAAMVLALAGQQPDDEALEGPGTHSSIAPPPGSGALP